MCIFVEIIERIDFSCSFLVAVLILPHGRNAGSFVPATLHFAAVIYSSGILAIHFIYVYADVL